MSNNKILENLNRISVEIEDLGSDIYDLSFQPLQDVVKGLDKCSDSAVNLSEQIDDVIEELRKLKQA